MSGLPLVEELSPVPDVMQALRAFSDLPSVVLLESSLKRELVGRYSFLVADPFAFEEIPRAVFGCDPFARIRTHMMNFTTPAVAGLPPFQGGAVGLLSYELGCAWEKLPITGVDEFELPAMAVGFYDWVIAWDHSTDQAWILSHGFPEEETSQRTDRAARRLQFVKERLQNNARPPESTGPSSRLPADRLSRQYPASGLKDLTSDFSHDGYLRAAERVIEYIFAGDIYQANLSQRLLYPAQQHPTGLYERLRTCNPAPFSGYFAHNDWAIVSASPERFVALRGSEIETRPIKGTRRRPSRPEADLYTRDELRESSKDQAENVMIVDLLRNDLSRVSAPGSVRVENLCAVESYETVQHLVSEIRANLNAQYDVWNLFEVICPGGSITGAPKVRAVEIIAELEPTVRGPYCGNLFYVGYNGQVDSNILIRTFICRKGWIQCPVGGGIVAQSNPEDEYAETLHKAEGMLRALDGR